MIALLPQQLEVCPWVACSLPRAHA